MTVRVNPAASRRLRASMDSQPVSGSRGGSRRDPPLCAQAACRSRWRWRTPWSVSYVSTSRTTLAASPAYASKASRLGVEQHHPRARACRGRGFQELARQHVEVAAHPPMYRRPRRAERAVRALCPPQSDSSTGSPCAARQSAPGLGGNQTLEMIRLSSGDSRSMQGTIGPETRSSGSCGKTAVPSGTASMSTRGSSCRR